MTGGDRISDLPDDLLQHILYFAPAKEGASTSALAWRWRTQWLSSGAVNLDTRSYPGDRMQLYNKRPAFVRDAGVALAAHGHRWPLRKFTVRVEGNQCLSVEVFLCRGDDVDDILDPMLKHQALRPVEELCIDGHAYRHQFQDRQESGYYELSVASLPSKNLRVLRISSCKCLKVPPASAPVAFPRLQELRLHFCSDVPLEGLQRVIDFAPQLAVLDFHSARLSSEYEAPTQDIIYSTSEYVAPTEDIDYNNTSEYDAPTEYRDYSTPPPPPPVTLRCPSVTALVLSDCTWLDHHHSRAVVDLYAPVLRCFRYKGDFERTVTLKSQATGLTRLDIGFYPNSFSTHDQTCASFSQCVESFNNAKVFKLKSNNIEFITAVSGGETRTALFRSLQLLELEVQYNPGQSKATGQAIAYLLHCCPVIRELRLTLSTTASETRSYGGYENETDPFGVKDELDFGKSVDQFFSRRGRKNPMITHEVSDHIHGLSGESFTCLQSSLRSVSLRFRRDKSECFGVRLAKFFAENALLLEELYIDGGNQKLHDHINHTVGRCVAGSGFAVLPLERSK
jgi:hypothetical protein